MKKRIEITKVKNGYIVECEDSNNTTKIYEADDKDPVIRMLYDILKYFDEMSS